MDQQVKKSACTYKDDYFDKFFCAKNSSQQRKQEAFEKFRPVFERVREQRRSAFLLKSGSKITPKKLTLGRMPTPQRICQNSLERTGKQEAFEKFRPVFERVREQRRSAFLLKSGSKITPKKLTLGRMPTPQRICQNSLERTGALVLSEPHQHSRKDLETVPSGGCKSSQRLNDAEESNVAYAVSSQECCRALEFESGDEEDPDDQTAPLRMMDITNMIRGASILQAPYQEQQQPKENHQQPKENHQPFMKKNPLCLTNTSLLKKTTYNLRNKQNKSDGSQFNVNSKQEKKVVFKTCLEDIHDQSSQVDIPMNKSLSHQTVNLSLGNVDEVKKKNFDAHHVENVDSSKNERSEKEQKSTRKILRRRSAVTSCIRTPSCRIAKKIPNFKSTSKLPKLNHVHPHIGKPLQRKSKVPVNQLAFSHTSTTRVDQKTDVPRTVVTFVDDSKTKDQENMIICKVDKCDASTNTTVRFVCGQSPDAQLFSEIKTLVEEQDQIDKKAELLEQTLARHKQMKESSLMESFCTSLSPLRRLQALLKEKEEYSTSDCVSSTSHKLEEDSSGDKSFLLCEASVFKETYSTPENSNADCDIPDTNVLEISSLNTADELNASHLHWNHLKQQNRFFQTPSNVPVKRFITQRMAQAEDEENLFKNEPSSASPFTELVGDCERPSLAPMTPHSRQQISQLKTCLKKQLEQLYD